MPLRTARECFSGTKTSEIEKLRAMVVDESSDVDKHNEKYLTTLHLAAKYGQADCVEELLKRGANPNRYSYYEFAVFRNAIVFSKNKTYLHQRFLTVY